MVESHYWWGFSLGDGASSFVVIVFGLSFGGVRVEPGAGELTLGSPISLGGLRLGCCVARKLAGSSVPFG